MSSPGLPTHKSRKLDEVGVKKQSPSMFPLLGRAEHVSTLHMTERGRFPETVRLSKDFNPVRHRLRARTSFVNQTTGAMRQHSTPCACGTDKSQEQHAEEGDPSRAQRGPSGNPSSTSTTSP